MSHLKKNEHYQIAIDGASGVGKSTIANKIAKELGFININTGIFFRSIAYYQNIFNIDTPENTIKTLKDKMDLTFNQNKAFFKGKDITSELFTPEITSLVSKTASNIVVRNYVLILERESAQNQNIVMEGRDIGTSVLPEATLKIFLTASKLVKAKRRFEQLKKNNQLNNKTLDQIKESLEKRDYLDSTRKIMPLIKAKDAIEINTDDLTQDQVVEKIKQLINKKIS